MINHYHLIADAKRNSLEPFFKHLHSIAGIALNGRHRKPGDTLITDERSYFARLKYVQG